MTIGRTLSLVLAAGSLTHVIAPQAAHAVNFNPVYAEVPGNLFNQRGADGLLTPLALQRRGAFEAGLAILRQSLPNVGAVLGGDGTINIAAEMMPFLPPIPAGALAGAAPFGFDANVAGGAGGNPANTAYPWALLNYRLRNNPVRPTVPLASGNRSVIDISFNSTSPWYYGTDGRPGAGQFDMAGTAVHEVIHGLGLFDSFTANQSATQWGVGAGNLQTVYDAFMRNAAVAQFTGPGTANPAPLGTTTSGGVTWAGTKGRHANGHPDANGVLNPNPSLFSPNPFQQGSSLAHLDEATYWGAWEMMTPTAPAAGEPMPHYLSPVVQGMLMDIGYTIVNAGGVEVGMKSLRKFWASAVAGNRDWSAASAWWDPAATIAGSIPVASDRVILQQPRMNNPTDSVVTLNVNATVQEVVNMNTLNVSGGNLTLTVQGLTNGGKINVSNGKTITTTTIDNIKGAYLPRRPGGAHFVSELTVSGANSKIVASDKVNNNAKITISNQGRLTAAKRFSNYNEAGTTLDIATGGRVVLDSVLSNGSAAKITIKDPNSRLLAYSDFTTNDGTIEASAGGQIGLKSLTNIGTLTVKGGSNTAGNQSRVWVTETAVNHGTIKVEGETPGPAHATDFHAGKITNHGMFDLVGNVDLTYNKLDNLGQMSFVGGVPRPADAARGLADDYEGIAFGGDMTNEGTGVLAGPGLMINSGDFINYSMMSTEWDTRASTLVFVPGNAGEVSDLRTNSAEHNNSLGGFDGGRIYAERMVMEDMEPITLRPPVLSPVDDPMDITARGTTGGIIPTLDVFNGVIYLLGTLDTPSNGLSQLRSNINAGLARIFDSTNPGRPVFEMIGPDTVNPNNIIRLIPGSPGAPVAGFYNNFALGSLEIYAGSSVMLQVPAPGVVGLLLAPATLALRRRRASDEA